MERNCVECPRVDNNIDYRDNSFDAAWFITSKPDLRKISNPMFLI